MLCIAFGYCIADNLQFFPLRRHWGMSIAAQTASTYTIWFPSQQVAVASYGRTVSSLRLALSTTLPSRPSRSFRGATVLRCYATATTAPLKAANKQQQQV